MSGRIEVIASRDNSSKWSRNETSIVRSAGVDIGEDSTPGTGKMAGRSMTIIQTRNGAIGTAGITEDTNNG